MITISWLTVLTYLSIAVAIDGVIKQVALKNGYTKLATICDFIADHAQAVIDVIKGILALTIQFGMKLTAKKTAPTTDEK